MNMTAGYATTVNQVTINSNNTTNNTVKTILPSTATQDIKITGSANSVVVNNLTLAQLDDGISRVETFYNTNGRLPNYVSFGSREIPIATFEINIATQGLKLNITSTVNGLTVAQMDNGISRVQAFHNKNSRLPNYVSFGTRNIPIMTFLENIGSKGLTINLPGASSVKPIYITSDNINSVSVDTARVNSIVQGLKAIGLYAVNWGLGPDTHDTILESGKLPQNALVVDIYGGADAGLIYEMGTNWYKSIKQNRSVYSIFLPPATCITGLAWLPKAHDDYNYPANFTGIAHPDLYLLDNGYQYLYSGDIATIITSIFKQATT